MKMIINLLGDGPTDACDTLELAETSARNCSRRPEMVQERLLAPYPYPGNLFERRAPKLLCALRAVSVDREAVRLVPQALQEIEDRIPRIEGERRTAWHEEALPSGIAVGTLGDRA